MELKESTFPVENIAMENNTQAPAQGKSEKTARAESCLREICDLAEGPIKALDWYAGELVQEIYQAGKEDYSLDDVHVTLIYQHVDSLNTLLDTMKSYLDKKEMQR